MSRYVGRQIHYHNYGVGPGLIGFDYVLCKGTEKDILECTHSIWGVHSCAQSEDAAISCFTGQRGITYVTGVKLKLTTTATIAARFTFYANCRIYFSPDTVHCFSSFFVSSLEVDLLSWDCLRTSLETYDSLWQNFCINSFEYCHCY